MSSVPTMVSPQRQLFISPEIGKRRISHQRFLQQEIRLPLVYYRLAYALHQSGDLDQAFEVLLQLPFSKNPNPNHPGYYGQSVQNFLQKTQPWFSEAWFWLRHVAMGYANLNDLESSTDFGTFVDPVRYTQCLQWSAFNNTYPCVTQAEAPVVLISGLVNGSLPNGYLRLRPE